MTIEDLSKLIVDQDIRLVGLKADDTLPGDAFSKFGAGVRLIEASVERAGMAKAWHAVTGTEHIEYEGGDPRVTPYSDIVEAIRELANAAQNVSSTQSAYLESIRGRSTRVKDKRKADFKEACLALASTGKETANKIVKAIDELTGGDKESSAGTILADQLFIAAHSRTAEEEVSLDVSFDIEETTAALTELLGPVRSVRDTIKDGTDATDSVKSTMELVRRAEATCTAAGGALAAAVTATGNEFASTVLRDALLAMWQHNDETSDTQ